MGTTVYAWIKPAARVFAFAVMGCLMAAGAIPAPAQGQSGTSISATVSAAGNITRTISYTWTLQDLASPSNASLAFNTGTTFTHTLKACRTPSSTVDTGSGVQGQVNVTNGGSVATQDLKIVVQVQDNVGSSGYQNLAGATQTIIPMNQIAATGSGSYPYTISFTPASGASYRVVATVTITNHSGSHGQPTGPSPAASFTPMQIVSIDGAATVTDSITQPANGYTINDSLSSPWNILSVDKTGCATRTFTIQATNTGASGGNSGLPITDTATLTGNDTMSQLAHATASVTVCDLADGETLESHCQIGELALERIFYFNMMLNTDQQQGNLTLLLKLMNQVRASVSTNRHPVPPLTRITTLDNAAQPYSQALVGHDLTHCLSDPTCVTDNPQIREEAQGYSDISVGENLASGQISPQQVITAWVNSPEHYANLINPKFNQVGLGLAGGGSSSDAFVLYWVADFGQSTTSYPTTTPTVVPLINAQTVENQIQTFLQRADMALCTGNTAALIAALDQGGLTDFWVSQFGTNKDFTSAMVDSCLTGVLGYYAATVGSLDSATFDTTNLYIAAALGAG